MSDATERLCALAKNGDTAAASELIAISYQRVFAYFRRLSGSENESADLTQKTFLKVWKALPSYEGRSSFNTWLHSIAHHVYVDWCRKPGRNDSKSADWWEIQPDKSPSPFDTTEEHDLARRLYGFVEKLDPATRETVHLHYYQGLSLSETADALGIAVSTVKYRLRAALDSIRPHLIQTESPTRKR